MECVKCKKDAGDGEYCRFCGTKLGVVPAPEDASDGKAVGKVLAGGCMVLASLLLVGFSVLLTVLQQLIPS
jgi:hypothetical protein